MFALCDCVELVAYRCKVTYCINGSATRNGTMVCVRCSPSIELWVLEREREGENGWWYIWIDWWKDESTATEANYPSVVVGLWIMSKLCSYFESSGNTWWIIIDWRDWMSSASVIPLICEKFCVRDVSAVVVVLVCSCFCSLERSYSLM